MSIMRIKRSGITGSPTSLAQGELAYSWVTGTQANGGDRLFIGTGTEVGSNAANIEVIGGKYFTDMLDHINGITTANSALIVDSDKKLTELGIDNLNIDGNTISATNTNGDIILAPNGIGNISASGRRITGAADPVNDQDVVTKAYMTAASGGSMNFAGDTGTDTLLFGSDTLTVGGTQGITTIVTNNQISVVLSNTAVTSGSYGNTTHFATFTVDAQGRLTTAGTTLAGGGLDQEGVEDVVGAMINTTTGLSVTYDDPSGKLNFVANNFTITLGGDLTGNATITSLANATLTATIAPNSVALGADTTGDYIASLVAGTGVSLVNNSGETATPTINIGQSVATTANVTFKDITATGNVQIDGNLTVSGDSTTFNVGNIYVEDNMIFLNNGAPVANPDLGWSGGYNDGAAKFAGMFRDATDGVFKVYKEYTVSPDATPYINIGHGSFQLAPFQANNFIGALTGNADTATILLTARTIGVSGITGTAQSFNGSANITIPITDVPATLLSGTVASARISGAYTAFTDITATGNTASGRFFSGLGTAALPSHSITGDPDTGMWSPSADQIALTTGGTNRLTANSTGVHATTFVGALTGNASTATTAAALTTGRTFTMAGGVTSDSPSFTGAANITITVSAVAATLLTGTVASARIAGAYTGFTDITATGNTASSRFQSALGTAALPAQTFTGDLDTGVWSPGADQVAIATAGVTRLTANATGVHATTFTGAHVGNSTTATALATARAIQLSGTVTGTANFDGSAAINIVTTGIDANNTTKGISSYNISEFTVSSGAVSILAIDGGTY